VGLETLSDRCPRGAPGCPPAGSEAPARVQPGPCSTLGGQIGQLAPREVAARLLPRLLLAGGACCGREPHPGGPHSPASDIWPPAGLQPAPPRTDRPAALQRGRACRAEAAPPPRGRAERRSGSMSAAEAAQNGQKWAKRAQQRSPRGAPEERLGALRPGLRRQRGANGVPVARWGVRWASWHRARSPRGFDHWCDVMRKMRAWPSVKPPVVPRKHKIPDPIKKNSTMKKICF
jgi:hypothetical protein